ncbi:MAG: hypothetical protein PGN34_06790 [Methylobacterium frigidaeris]
MAAASVLPGREPARASSTGDGAGPAPAKGTGAVIAGLSPIRLQVAAVAGNLWLATTDRADQGIPAAAASEATPSQLFQSLVVAIRTDDGDLANLAFDPDRIVELRAELHETRDPVRAQTIRKLIRLWDTWTMDRGAKAGTGDDQAPH